jgi:excisionase family DNA binding protein
MATEVKSPSRMLTVKEAAELLAVRPMTIYRLIYARVLPAFQLHGPRSAIRIDEAELREWMESR